MARTMSRQHTESSVPREEPVICCSPSRRATLSADWDVTVKKLLRQLEGGKLLGSARAPSLRRFLLRVDFNGVLGGKGGDGGGSDDEGAM